MAAGRLAGRRILGAARRIPGWTKAGARGARAAGVAFLDLLAPGFCRECGAEVAAHEDPFCEACRAEIRWIGPACARCALPMASPPRPPAGAASPPPCGSCAPQGLAFDLAGAGGVYDGPLRTAVLRYKFHGDAALAPVLVDGLDRAAGAPLVAAALLQAEAIVPVPLHPLKRWWRGRDPVAELARAFAARRPAGAASKVAEWLRKVRWSPAQARLGRGGRSRNLRGAFAVRAGARVPPCVVLLDDVLTTGATASECARALKRAGARTVVLLAAARST
ncbi:MAG: ComF family protein [Planctomycetes bacterium]|nr:ComF family protein [Planctomycetota bacterium]